MKQVDKVFNNQNRTIMGWTKELWRLMEEEQMSRNDAMEVLLAMRRKQKQNEQYREHQENLLGGSQEGQGRTE